MAEQKLLAVGSKAPAFSLQTENGKIVTLKELIGTSPIVLIFYPGDMTPGCTMQLCAVRDDWKEFEAAGIRVFGVNHADAESHTTFKKTYQFPFPLLIDTGKKVSAAYSAVKKFFKTTVINRTVVGIDTQGMIIYYKRGMPKNADILKAFGKQKTT
jgi:peroxiredoxin Q/BCP